MVVGVSGWHTTLLPLLASLVHTHALSGSDSEGFMHSGEAYSHPPSFRSAQLPFSGIGAERTEGPASA